RTGKLHRHPTPIHPRCRGTVHRRRQSALHRFSVRTLCGTTLKTTKERHHMPQEYRLSTGAKFTLGVAVAAVPIATVAGIFALTDDTMHPHQQSKLAEQYTSQTLELRAGSEIMKF